MSMPIETTAGLGDVAAAEAPAQAVPGYLERDYWWAYVHPSAVRLFERGWLVDLILFGNYARLRDAALDALAEPGIGAVTGRTLQLACVYGNLTPRLVRRLAPAASLDVVDVLPIQLRNLHRKLPADDRIGLVLSDASRLPCEDASYDRALLFFLLHEQPEAVRRATLAEALRVVRPGGRIVIVDYHRPVPLHPMRPLMRLVFAGLEPYAHELWRQPLLDFLPPGAAPRVVSHDTYFGGLYQRLVLER